MSRIHVTSPIGEEYKVSFAHIRPTTEPRDIGAFDSTQVAGLRDRSNGATICSIYAADGVLVACDAAVCSLSDNFSRRAGRKLAFTRALSTIPREQRSMFWTKFHLSEKGGWQYVVERE